MKTFTTKQLKEIFVHEGVTLQCVESKYGAFCDGCYFRREQGDQWINDCVDEHKCHSLNRKDKKIIIFEKLDI